MGTGFLAWSKMQPAWVDFQTHNFLGGIANPSITIKRRWVNLTFTKGTWQFNVIFSAYHKRHKVPYKTATFAPMFRHRQILTKGSNFYKRTRKVGVAHTHKCAQHAVGLLVLPVLEPLWAVWQLPSGTEVGGKWLATPPKDIARSAWKSKTLGVLCLLCPKFEMGTPKFEKTLGLCA